MPVNYNPSKFRTLGTFTCNNYTSRLWHFIPSRVSGGGYKIGPVFLCVCVCLSVSERSHSRTVWPRVTKFGVGMDLGKISAKFEGQGHRSKVATLKTSFSGVPEGLSCVVPLCNLTSCDVTAWRHVTSQYDVMTSWYDVMTSYDVMVRHHDITAWRLDILWRLLGKNTDKGARRGRARQRSGVFICAITKAYKEYDLSHRKSCTVAIHICPIQSVLDVLPSKFHCLKWDDEPNCTVVTLLL